MEHSRRVVPEPFDDAGDLPRIFVFVNTRYGTGDVLPIAIAEDGQGLCSHFCSGDGWALHDMGLTSDWKHDVYLRKYPQGFELVWLDNPLTDPRFAAVLPLCKRTEEAEVPTA